MIRTGSFENMDGKFGESSHGQDPEMLAMDFMTMSNDSFFNKYGFNWVPPMWLQKDVERKLGVEQSVFGLIPPGIQ